MKERIFCSYETKAIAGSRRTGGSRAREDREGRVWVTEGVVAKRDIV
jgi:hypothetical protein